MSSALLMQSDACCSVHKSYVRYELPSLCVTGDCRKITASERVFVYALLAFQGAMRSVTTLLCEGGANIDIFAAIWPIWECSVG